MHRSFDFLRPALTASARLAALVWLVGAIPACTITSLAEGERQIIVNECEPGDSCGAGQCRAGMCVAESGSITKLLFEIRPTTTARELGGQVFLQLGDVKGGSTDVVIDEISLVGSNPGEVAADCVFVDPDTGNQLLTALDGSIPSTFTFRRYEQTWGLSPKEREVEVDRTSAGPTARLAGFEFRTQIPAGKYDVYIKPFPLHPTSPPRTGCWAPPQLIRGTSIDDGPSRSAGVTELRPPARMPSQLDLEVRWPATEPSLAGWALDMLDPLTGLVISTVAQLGTPSVAANTGVRRYPVRLYYLPVLEAVSKNELEASDTTVAAAPGTELVRLTPPEGVVAPIVLIERSALELLSKGSGVIDQFAHLPQAVTFNARVGDGLAGVPAMVSFTATRISGIPKGTLASFVLPARPTRADGQFSVRLLPGSYSVQVVPSGSTGALASLVTELDVAASPSTQSGRMIQLPPSFELTGRVVGPGSEGARGAVVSAELSPSSNTLTVLDRALGVVEREARFATASVDTEVGNFMLNTDPGLFNLMVRPPDGSNLPWLLMPRLNVPAGGERSHALGRLQLGLPVRLQTNVRLADRVDTEGLLAGATVRAYALLDSKGNLTDEPKVTRSLLPVAEGRLAENGRVVLLIPAQVNPAPEIAPP
ncbi:MAG TPA: hypothetical protein VER33_23070 [Polyangiaceae bacterium]|nr:hypothetical protein [Polyangiaceae bacterium]